MPRLTRLLPPVALLAAAYVPLVLTAPGAVVADTKAYLYLDPSRLLSRAASMWDPSMGMGTVTHQNIGYLWPMGPWYWIFDKLGAPDWLAQRLLLGTILALAGFGVVWLLRTLDWQGPEPWAAAFLYALTPYVLTAAARVSVLLLPFAAMPWLIAIVVRALRERSWRWPAVFALVVTTVGSVDLSALALAGIGPALWVVWAVAIRDVSLRRATAAVARMGLLTVPVSLWWLAGLWVERGWGLDVSRYRETARAVAETSTANEVLRGLGYWSFYGGDRLGPWIEPSSHYTTRLAIIALSYAIPIGALTAIGFARWRHRGFFVLLLAVGTVVAVGAYPWDDPTLFGRGLQGFLESRIGFAMRSLSRATPLVALAMATFAAGGIVAVARRAARVRWPAVLAVMAIALMNMPALWLGEMVPQNLRRDEDLPAYWIEAATALDGRGGGTRVLEIPGSDFASYRWGTTVDPVLAGLMDRPTVARELIPSGTEPSANLLIALDHRLQEGTLDPPALAVLARLLNAGDVVVRSDLQYERYGTPRPRNLWDLVSHAPGLGEPPTTFGKPFTNMPVPQASLFDELFLQTDPRLPDPPPVAAFPVDDSVPIVRTQPSDRPLVVAGDGEGVVDAAGLGLIEGRELILYSASRPAIDAGAALLVTDSNRRDDLPVFRDDAGDDTRTVAVNEGGVEAQRLPPDLLSAIGPSANDHPLAVLVTRQRAMPSDATSTDEELALVRSFALPAPRSFALSGRARLSAIAADTILDDLVGTTVPGIPVDVRATSSIRLNGDRTARGSSTIDGDPSTAWTTQFATSVGQWVEYTTAAPATIDHVELSVLADGWHSVPTALQVTADGRDLGTVPVPAITDDPEHRLGTTATVDVPIPATTAATIRLTIAGVRAVETIDSNGGEPIAMPVAIAEAAFGPTPITLPRPLDALDTGCRTDLLTVDGQPVGLRISASTASALRGDPLTVEACDGPLALTAGDHVIEAQQGRTSGLDLDQLVLRSDAGGAASVETGPLTNDTATTPRIAVTSDDRWRMHADVTGARPGQSFWLTLGQSYSDGWEISIDGAARTEDSTPRLVNGYANGWLVIPATSTFSVTLTFAPQRIVNVALLASAAAALLCIGLALWPRAQPVRIPGVLDEPQSRDLEPAAFTPAAWLTYGDRSPPRWVWSVAASVGLTALFAALAGLVVGLVVGGAALVASRWMRGRFLLTLGSPAALAVAAGYVLWTQARHHIAPGIEWPHEMGRAHPFGWLAVGLLVAEAVVSRLRSRTPVKVSTATSRRHAPAHARRRRRGRGAVSRR